MIDRAVEILRAGGLVAFSTETVYGLGADARNPQAVAKIFAAKGRPATNPLIVHVHSVEAAKRYAREWPSIADQLAEKFWPGPLTLVVRKSDSIVDAVAAGGTTVGLRVPKHDLALALLQAFDGPVAAPSANRSNRISPTTAEHVWQELGDRVDLILDGGPCKVGIESTVLDLTQSVPTILRPGRITASDLRHCVGEVAERLERIDSSETARSPGQQEVHYAPKTPSWYCNPTETFTGERSIPRPFAMMCSDWQSCLYDVATVIMPSTVAQYEEQFYREIRKLDELGAAAILIHLPPDKPEWTAVRDRITRAAKPWRAMFQASG